MRHSKLRTTLRIVGFGLLGLLGLIIVTLTTGLLVARTHYGQQKILGILLPVINKSLTGRVEVGDIGGNLLTRLVLRDVKLFDSENQLAASVARVEARYNLLHIVRRDVHITFGEVQDAHVHLRFLKDGRLNFAALTRPSPKGGPLPVSITVVNAGVDLGVVFDPPPAVPPAAPLPRAEAQLHLEAGMKFADPRVTVDVKTLKVRSSQPLGADLELHGGANILIIETPQIEARDIALSVKTMGEEINRLAQAAALRGEWQLSMMFRGPLTALQIEGALQAPKGQLTLHAKAGLLDEKLPWQLQVQAQGVDPSAAREGLPAGNIDLFIAGQGQGPRGRVELKQLQVNLAENKARASLQANGFVDGDARIPIGFPVPRGITAQLALTADAPDLAPILKPFAPTLKAGGAIQIKTTAAIANGELRIDLDVDGQRLRAADQSVETLKLALHTVDLSGKLELHARTVKTPLKLDRFDLDGSFDPKQMAIHAIGIDEKARVLELAVLGQPKLRDKELLRLDATVNQLMVARGDDRLLLRTPAHIAIDMQPPTGPIIDLDRLALHVGDQELAASGHFEAKTQVFRASVMAQSINARRWAQLAGVTQLPDTSINLRAQAGGTPQDIEGKLQLNGTAAAMPKFHLPRSTTKLAVTLRNKRAEGDLDLRLGSTVGGEGPHATLRFAAPLALSGPIRVELDATTLAQEFRAMLPPAVYNLRAPLALHASVNGTLQRPEVAVDLKVSGWQLDPLRGRDLALAVNYAKEQLKVHLDARLYSARDAQLAAVLFDAQTRVRLGVSPNMNGEELKRQFLHGAMLVDATVSHVDLPKVLAAVAPAQEPPISRGRVDAKLHIEGTPTTPKLKFSANANGVTAQGIRNIAAGVTVDYADSALRAEVKAGLPQQLLLDAHAETTLPMARVMAGDLNPKQLPVRAKLAVLPFELSQVSNIRGSLSAQAELKGTAGAPEVTAQVRSDSLKLDNFAIGPLSVDVSLDKQRMLKADVDIKQPNGLLKLTANTQIPPKPETLQIALLSKNFHIDYSPTVGGANLTDVIGMARGALNADLKVKMSDRLPSVRGFVKLENGGIMMKALQQPLTDIYVDVQVAPDDKDAKKSTITLREVRAIADTGRAKVSGSVQLDGLKLQDVSLDAETRNFPVWAGVYGLFVDGRVEVRGKTEGNTLKVAVNMPSGAVRMPKLMSVRTVQPLGPFEDVELVDKAAKQQAAREEAVAKKEAEERAEKSKTGSGFLPPNIKVAIKLPEAFQATGPELRAAVTGNVDIELGPDFIPRITGEVRTTAGWGWVEIFRRRYEINRVIVSMNGEKPPNPLFNIEIARKVDEGTIYIMVSGTGKRPRVSFRSDPPVYDQSQIIAMILTGENGGAKKDPQAMGMLSSLLIGQLRDQLAGRLPIDVIRVDVAGSDPMGVTSSSLEIGKYLRDDVYLGYKRRFGGVTTGMRRLNADEALLEYHFFRSYKLRTLYGDANVGAIDLYWTKRF